jgi:hypothetical protein
VRAKETVRIQHLHEQWDEEFYNQEKLKKDYERQSASYVRTGHLKLINSPLAEDILKILWTPDSSNQNFNDFIPSVFKEISSLTGYYWSRATTGKCRHCSKCCFARFRAYVLTLRRIATLARDSRQCEDQLSQDFERFEKHGHVHVQAIDSKYDRTNPGHRIGSRIAF